MKASNSPLLYINLSNRSHIAHVVSAKLSGIFFEPRLILQTPFCVPKVSGLVGHRLAKNVAGSYLSKVVRDCNAVDKNYRDLEVKRKLEK